MFAAPRGARWLFGLLVIVACGDDGGPGGSTSTGSTANTTATSSGSTATSKASANATATSNGSTANATGSTANATASTAVASSSANASTGASTGSGGDGGAGGAPPTTNIRVVAGNLSSGNFQSYTLGHGTRIFAGSHADIALVQEMNAGSNSPTDLRAFVDAAFGPEFVYHRGSGDIPNGITSRFPILASGEWEDASSPNREFTWARVDVPGSIDLWAISVHLLTSSAGNRNVEANALINFIDANVPPSDYLVLGGDFNTDVRSEQALTTLSQSFVTSAPYPVDQLGNDNTNAGRSKPYDWVLADPDLHAHATSTVLPSQSFPNGLVLDTRIHVPLSDVAPAMQSDSGAPSMQHMLVVRDFALPTP